MSAPAFVASRHQAKSCASRLAIEGDGFDRALIASIAHGDQTAFQELHARYYHRITHFVLAVTHRSDLVGEVANDTLWVVWQCAARFRGESKVSTWIMGITRNLSFQAIRAIREGRRNRGRKGCGLWPLPVSLQRAIQLRGVASGDARYFDCAASPTVGR